MNTRGSESDPRQNIDKTNGKNTDNMSDSITVRKLQSTKSQNAKRDPNQIIIPPFVNSSDYSFSDKKKAAAAAASSCKTLPTRLTPPTMSTKLIKPSIFVDKTALKTDETPKARLRFNVMEFRKKVNIRAVAMAELAFVKIAGKKVIVQPSKEPLV